MEVWGTWEELVLASAVLRHGAARWEAVVLELRARTFSPGRFTSEVCKAKYEDLQKQHSTCSDLLEELRKQRIAELKQTVEKFDGSIGFLQMKLQTLRDKKGHSSSVEYQSSPLESPAQTPGKDPSKDGLSAGSFTQDRSPPAASLEAVEIRQPPPAGTSLQEKRPVPVDLARSIHMELGIGVKKKRGKRKRRGCGQVQDIKEENIDETVLQPATNRNLPLLARVKVEPASDCDLGCGPHYPGHELTRVLDMISSNEYASIFRRRLDSQKRARYRKIVRRHMDLDTIRSRIDERAITSIKELLRDVLLLASNAAVFYSRNTREHKYAVFLKGVVVKLVMEHEKNSFSGQTDPAVATSPDPAVAPVMPASAPPVKPASPGPGPLDSQRSSDKLRSDEKISKAPKRPQMHGKPKDSLKTSRQAEKADRQTRNAKDDGSMRRSPVKPAASVNQLNAKVDGSLLQRKVNSASVYEHDFNEGSRQQQPQLKLPSAAVGERDINDLSRRRQAQVKLGASVSDPKERKRAQKKVRKGL
uniref:Bromo domain-containing protein n=2 Tax=Kalanchoe fedtschenkoi TaxID=63787 RepID=A0A7N0TJF6_KALFE